MTNLTNFDIKLIVLFKLLTKGHNIIVGKNVVKLTEIAYRHSILYIRIS